MKKNFLKLMAVTAALTGLASCADDFGLGQTAVQGKADLTATFESYDNATRLGMLEKDGDNPWASGDAAGWGWVFTTGDKVRVWSLEAMTYEVYNLTGGMDTPNGVFEKDEASKTLEAGKDRWAITDAQFAYALSPNDEGTPVLTYTIPYQYYANSHASSSDENVRQFPAPFWGQAKLADDGSLNVGFRALTAFLRIEMATLPDEAKYIVLTTHGDATTTDGGTTIDYDGFQLVQPDPSKAWLGDGTDKVKLADGSLVTFEDKLTFWDPARIKPTIDGTSEALSGTFNTTLVDKDSKLGVDQGLSGAEYAMAGISRLVNRDEIIIDVQQFKDDNPDGVFWIPVIAQHYNQLYVMAVTEKSKFAYKYVGTMLKEYYDWTPKVGGKYRLTMNLENLGKTCAYQLNKAIKNINKENKYKLAATNILNVDELRDCTGHWYYNTAGKLCHRDEFTDEVWDLSIPADQILVQGKGDLELNIAEITATPQSKGGWSPVRDDLEPYAATGKTEVLYVSDFNYNTSVVSTTGDLWNEREGVNNKSAVKSVMINMPYNWAADATDGDKKALLSDLPAYDAIFAANNKFAPAVQLGAEFLDIYAYGSATEWMSASELSLLKNGTELEISKLLKTTAKSAIAVINGIRSLEVKSTTKGDVNVTDATGEKVEINDKLTIKTVKGINVRVNNSLVDKVYFQETSNKENYLISLGSAAYRMVNVDGDAATEPANAKKPNRLTLLSYWTGYALDIDAINVKNYDTGTVYTVAQLASMGEEIDGSTTNKYLVNDLLEDMWLGGSIYPWLGPNVTIAGFEFDGNGVALKKMTMPLVAEAAVDADGYEKPVYAYDPHICCTTCGFDRHVELTLDHTGTAAVPLTSYGLIRSIISNGADKNVITNVKLNDVYFIGKDKDGNPTSVCNNVGSIVGLVNIGSADIDYDNNEVGEVQIDMINNSIGGMTGRIQKAGKVLINRNRVGNSTDFQYGTGYVRGKNYVGGLVGYVDTNETVAGVRSLKITDSKVELGKDIKASGSYAGGLVGRAFIGAKADIWSTSVKTPLVKAKNFAAGNVGYLYADEGLIKEVAVDVDVINATNQYAAGLIASNKVNTLDIETADITIKNTLNATNGFAGGEVGYSYYGRINVGKNFTDDVNYPTTIKIGTLKGAYDLGGIIGNNDNNADVYVLAGIKNNDDDKFKCTIDIDINKFVNSKGNTVEALYTYFKPTDAEDISHLAGTISNVAGRVDGKLYVNELNLSVDDILQGAQKISVGYQNRPSMKHAGTPERFFWGDYNGYVGWGKSGNYYLTDKSSDDAVLQNAYNQVTGDQEGFNLYREKGDDYNKTSKNAPAI